MDINDKINKLKELASFDNSSYESLASDVLEELNKRIETQEEWKNRLLTLQNQLSSHLSNHLDFGVKPDSREKINRCPNCGSREINKQRGVGVTRYGCSRCFTRTKYRNTDDQAFEAWQAGDSG